MMFATFGCATQKVKQDEPGITMALGHSSDKDFLLGALIVLGTVLQSSDQSAWNSTFAPNWNFPENMSPETQCCTRNSNTDSYIYDRRPK